MKEIVFSQLTKNYDDLIAIDDINLSINRGEFFVVVGPTGCGKTTFLKLIAGVLEPTRGKIYFDGDLVNDKSPAERRVRMVFEDHALFPHMKVYEEKKYSNLNFPLKLKNSPLDLIRDRISDIVNRLGISSTLFDRKPNQLSEGQKQQVALGHALTITPEVLLLDEPLRDLDPSSRLKARKEIQELHRDLESTTVYVTHDLSEAFLLGDRVGVMKEGRFIQVGEPKEIRNNPRSKFVSDFIESYTETIKDVFEEE